MAITPEQAQAEIDRRQAARAELTRRQQSNEQNSGMLGSLAHSALIEGILGAGDQAKDFIKSSLDFSPQKLVNYFAGPFAAPQKATNPFANALESNPSGEGTAYNRGKNAIRLAELGAGGVGLYRLGKLGLRAGMNALLPYLAKHADPENVLFNLEASQGTPTSIGRILTNPTLNFLHENIASHLPFSGVHKGMEETATGIINTGENLVGKYARGNPPEAAHSELGKALNNAKTIQEQLKIKNYNRVNDLAEKEKLATDTPRFASLAEKYHDDLEKTALLQFEPEAKQLINKLKNYKNPTLVKKSSILTSSGAPFQTTTSPTIKEANILSGKLNDLGEKYLQSQDRSQHSAGKVFKSLGKALKEDIRHNISKGSPELQNEFKNAEEHYANNFSNFLEKDIHKFTSGKEHPEKLIRTFIKTGRNNDDVTQLNNLMRVLKPEEQDLVRHAYFTSAIEGPEHARYVNAKQLTKLWSDASLGPNQKKVLVPDANQRRELDKFVRLVELNPRALDLAYNPKTGYANLLLSILSPKASLAGKALGARNLNTFLTSQETKNKLLNLVKAKQNKNALLKRNP